MSYPRSNEPRPAALPPETRTVGQVIADSIRIYGENFFRCLVIGIPPALLTLGGEHLSRLASLLPTRTVGGPLLTAAYVYACIVVLRLHPTRDRVVLAWLVGWLVFIPAPFLLIGFILPSLAYLSAFGLVVPVLLVEPLGIGAALRRAWRLARADYIHVLGSLAALA